MKFGFFIFSQKILSENQILTTEKGGKRGFRFYPDWDVPENKQAEKTKKWQSKYFIDLTNLKDVNSEKFTSIINSN